ncbi:unannotated protein [freshwater metagenome]|uniref:Unannotated protein n=1 Tax=freshwater metagenome TaxID=449393 RepID=A0A6J7DW94_9ZZZZ
MPWLLCGARALFVLGLIAAKCSLSQQVLRAHSHECVANPGSPISFSLIQVQLLYDTSPT